MEACCFVIGIIVLIPVANAIWAALKSPINRQQQIREVGNRSLEAAKARNEIVVSEMHKKNQERQHQREAALKQWDEFREGWKSRSNTDMSPDFSVEFAARYAEFCNSGDYILIERFALQFDEGWDINDCKGLRIFIKAKERASKNRHERELILDFAKYKQSYGQLELLKGVLEKKGWDFSDDEVLTFVEHAKRYRRLINGKERILRSNPVSREEILDAFFDIATSQDEEMLVSLALILNEKGESVIPLSKLKDELQSLERNKELNIFEKSLVQGREDPSHSLDLLSEIDLMTGYEFEAFLGSLFKKMGYTVEQTRLSGDQGADLIVIKHAERAVVQAKRSNSRIGNKAVQEVLASVALYRAEKGMVFSNSYFTAPAIELAKVNRIEIVDRDVLKEMLLKYW